VFYIGVIQKYTLAISQRHRYIDEMVTKTVKQTPLQLKVTGKNTREIISIGWNLCGNVTTFTRRVAA